MEQKIRRDRCMGDTLRRLRNERDISQEKLCAARQLGGCDIGRTAYAKYAAGELNIRAGVRIALHELYGCGYDNFFKDLKNDPRHSVWSIGGLFLYSYCNTVWLARVADVRQI